MSADKVLIKYQGVNYDAFDPATYVSTYYSSITGQHEEGDAMKFFHDGLYEAFKPGDITGKQLLDVGTGPIPNMAFNAAPWFEEITLSDFSGKNLEFLKKWRDGEINHMGPVFEYLVQLEKSGSMAERQDELRRKIRNIVVCDVTKPNPVASTVADGVIFDAITCSNCLEVASITQDDYAKSVRNVSSLLKPGGHLVLQGALEQTFYRVGEFGFECCPITKNQLQDIFQKEGFKILSLKDLNENYTPHTDENYYSDFKNVFSMVAKKAEK